jgi:RNA polymerase sigma-70 factor (ECF subfamily)
MPTGPGEPAGSDGERELVERLRAGDEEAFARLVRSCGGPLLVAARRFMRNEEDARDAVQEAFMKAHRSFGQFKAGSRVSTWVHRILVTTCLMKLRSQRRRPEESIDDLLPRFVDDGHTAEPCSEWADDPARAFERRELCTLVRSLIDRLPETLRTVILLRDIEELDTAEVATLLGVTENAVKIRLHRARQALRALMDPHFREVRA